MGQNGESTVSNVTISQRADALEKAEQEAAAKSGEQPKGDEGKEPAADAKAKADKEAADKVASEKAEADKKAAEDVKAKEKKAPNDPDELRKWNTRVSQENKKMRDELAALREAQEKTLKVLSGLSKKPVDLKELAKDPEKLQKFIDDERENASSEYKEKLDKFEADNKTKDTVIARMEREKDAENYPEWKRLFPVIQKIAVGPTGQGDPRVDYTKPAGEVLDQLYAIAVQENPASAVTEPPKPVEKTYTETEMKAMIADMLSKEKDAISKTAKEEAAKEALKGLNEEAKGGTVASAGKGAGRVPSDHLAAFKKMSLSEQREWLIAQNNQ